jgi:GT2 family glycosyltransferase
MASKAQLPLVTAIIPVRNRRQITLRFLNHLSQQTYPTLQAVVVDANSTDGTTDAIRKAYPTMEVLQAGEWDYWAGATNRGVRHALDHGSEWLLTVNDDSVIDPGYVELLVQLARENHCHILGSQINYLHDPDRVWSLGAFNAWGSSKFLKLAHHGDLTSSIRERYGAANVLPVDTLPGNGVLIHHTVFRRIGLYNALLLPHYHADSELAMRAARRGVQAWVTPNVVLLNDFSPSQKVLPLRSMKGLLWSLGHPKSHLYLPALLYIFIRYCPAKRKLSGLQALWLRFLTLGNLSQKADL